MGWIPICSRSASTILQEDKPDDYVIGTGEAHSVREFVEEAFGYAGLDWRDFVEVDPRYLRPAEVDVLIADAAKARERLSWAPKIAFKELVRIMRHMAFTYSGA